MTMFGRDSIFTSLQALPFQSELAATTLRVLGEWQGTRIDDFRDEDPGRILHEMRYGEMAAFEERPHTPYYGSVDATPLYVILLDEYERWTGDRALVRELEREARAAINWIDQYADLMGNGYISYKRRNEKTGLENQSWKDSWNSISYADGRLPGFPRATCELQGYAYDAKVRAARLARLVWKDEAYADRLEAEAADLKRRFNRDFWLADRGYYALALDADGTPGRLARLEQRPPALERDRRRQQGQVRRRPPHGPAAVVGLGRPDARRGRGPLQPGRLPPRHGLAVRQLVHRLGPAALRVQGGGGARSRAGILDAAEVFEGRLPEAFGGYDRDLTKYPVKYPTACSPQAWSTGAPLLLLRTMLGLEPIGDHLIVDPALPVEHRPPRAARHPRSMGPDRRLRPRPGRSSTTRAPATAAGRRRPPGRPQERRSHDRGRNADPGRRRRRRVRRRRLRPGAGEARRHRRHADRQERLPPVPAAALPGRDVDAGRRRHRLSAPPHRRGVRRLHREARRGHLDRPGGEDRDDRHAARRTRATTSSSPPAPSRTSSRPPAPSTPSRSTRSTTRTASGPGSSRRSRRPTGIRIASTRARSTS